MKNIIVGQSGGPTAVINGSLYGVTSEGLKHQEKIDHVYGMINGIEGFLNDQIMDMGALSDNGELEFVRTTPEPILAHAVTNCRKICQIRYTLFYFRKWRKKILDTSSISAEMILWIL